MINPYNASLVDALAKIIQDHERDGQNALIYDLHERLGQIIEKFGEDYPGCGTCRRPALGASNGCAECKARHPEFYARSYGDSPLCQN